MKQVAILVKDDVTELNKRLASGFQVSTNYRLENGDHMFILYKYEQTKSTNLVRGMLDATEGYGISSPFTGGLNVIESNSPQSEG